MGCCLLLASSLGFAQLSPTVSDYNTAPLVAGATPTNLLVQDNDFVSSLPAGMNIQQIPAGSNNGVLFLRIDNSAMPTFKSLSFSADVTFRIESKKWVLQGSNYAVQTQSNFNVTLKVEYSPSGTYKGEAFYILEDVAEVRAVVTNVSVTGGISSQPLPAYIKAELNLFSNKKFSFNPTLSVYQGIYLQSLPVVNNKLPLSVNVSSNDVRGIDEFDLEWTFVDFEESGRYPFESLTSQQEQSADYINQVASVFREGGTRVTLKASGSEANLQHNIELIYPKGFLLYRFRLVHYDDNGTRIEGPWLYRNGTSNYRYFIGNDYQSTKNWQYTASYAENGKKKEVVTYFDGLNKLRQSVTLNNSDQIAVVQENVLDALGRPVMQVLPAPVFNANGADKTLDFKQGVNQVSAGNPFTFTNFTTNPGNIVSASPLNNNSVSASYYSNRWKSIISNYDQLNPFNATVPDAEGYTYSLTQYTNDMTGRIKRQGGVGQTMQPGTSHETVYYYGKPLQKELFRMFGREAGKSSHYLKTMVKDPNGQFSVSYTNSSGKTIATALVGTGTNNLHNLPSNNQSSETAISENLIRGELLQIDKATQSVFFQSTFMANLPGQYNIEFQLGPTYLQTIAQQGGSTICSNCYYDYNVKVVNEIGEVLINEVISEQNFDFTCSPGNTKNQTFGFPVTEPGTLFIQFSAKVSGKAVADNWEFFKNNNPDIRTLESFKRQYIREMDYTSCFSDCNACVSSLGTIFDFKSAVQEIFTAMEVPYTSDDDNWAGTLYQTLSAHCVSIQAACNLAPCDIYKDRMIMDVSPGGQYAMYDPETFELLEEEISVITFARRQNLSFVNAQGNPIIVTLADGTTKTPKQLTDREFIEYFELEWANALLPLHPEYCFLQYCQNVNSSSAAFYDKLISLNTADKAISQGLFSTTSDYSTMLVNSDPFFAVGGPGAAKKTEMTNKMNAFQINTISNQSLSIKGFTDFMLYCLMNPVNLSNCLIPTGSCRNPDLEWHLFKTLYASARAPYEEVAMKQNPAYQNCTNCYIGTSLVGELDGLSSGIEGFSSEEGSAQNGNLQMNTFGAEVQAEEGVNASSSNALSSIPFVRLTFEEAKNLPSYVLQEGRYFHKFRTLEWRDTAYRKIELDSIYLFIKTQMPDSAVEKLNEHLGHITYSTFSTGGTQNKLLFDNLFSQNEEQQKLSSQYFCNAPNGTVVDYTGGNPRTIYIYCSWQPISVICQDDPIYYDFLAVVDQFYNYTYYYGVYVCTPVDESESCELGFYTLSNGSNVQVTTSSRAFIGYTQGSFYSSITLNFNDGSSCTFSNVYVHYEQVTPPATCSSLTYTHNFISCAGGKSGIEIVQSPSFTEYTYKKFVITGIPLSGGNRQILYSGVAKFSPGNSFYSVCLPFSTSQFSDVQVELATNVCNTCNEGIYYLNGQEVFVTFGADPVPNNFFNPQFYPTVTVSNFAQNQFCTFTNATVYQKNNSTLSGACPEYAIPFVANYYADQSAGTTTCTYSYGFDPNNPNGQTGTVFRKVFVVNATIPEARPYPVNVVITGQFVNLPSFSNCVNEYILDGQFSIYITIPANQTTGSTEVGVWVPVNDPDLVNLAVNFQQISCPTNAGSCPAVPFGELYAYKRKVFDGLGFTDYSNLFGSQSGGSQPGQEYVQRALTNSCDDAADYWLDLLSDCVNINDEALRNNLKEKLISICKSGNSFELVEGVRTRPINSSTLPNSFKEAFESVFGVGALNNLCNDLLLESPFPHTTRQSPVAPLKMILVSELPSCSKNILLGWRTAFQANNGGYANLADYIKNVATVNGQFFNNGVGYKVGEMFTLSQEDLNVIYQGIDDNCIYFSRSVELPPVLQCGQFITPHEIGVYISQFSTAYPYISSGGSNYWSLLTTFINHKLGSNFAPFALQEFYQTAGQQFVLSYKFINEASPTDPLSCFRNQVSIAVGRAINDYTVYIEQEKRVFEQRYIDRCLSMLPAITLNGLIREYHYTLYYYDQAGNLVKTVPPAGVQLLNDAQVSSLMSNPDANIVPAHQLPTVYKYNAQNQVVWQYTPDAGISRFWYDRVGRLSASQNSKQILSSQYSYTIYDEFSRIIEVGEKSYGTGAPFVLAASDGPLGRSNDLMATIRLNELHTNLQIDEYIASQSILLEPGFSTGGDPTLSFLVGASPVTENDFWQNFYASGSNDQVTKTFYDNDAHLSQSNPTQSNRPVQINLRKRVASTVYLDRSGSGGILEKRHATHYTYDVAGNVSSLWQEQTLLTAINDKHRFKRMDYDFDLISGKVNRVRYQQGYQDEINYLYQYDAENRLTGAYSSLNGVVWKRDAAYYYYLHGPLARMELGDDRLSNILQGVDYTYTLQGWLKGINGQRLDPLADPGHDGKAGHLHSSIGRDVLGYHLGYYSNDYKMSGTNLFGMTYQPPGSVQSGNALYNGNISYTTVAIRGIDNGNVSGYTYGYDQLNRIVQFRRKALTAGTGNWAQDATASSPYSATYSYDANGNIQELLRRGVGTSLNMDQLSYSYQAGTNRLLRVSDAYGSAGVGDLPHQVDAINYEYDPIGNLVKDRSEGIDQISWTVYGKIWEIQKQGAGSAIKYRYDASGNRVYKEGADGTKTFYVRDATGNTMAIYEKTGMGSLVLKEQELYGSSRLGTYQRNVEVENLGEQLIMGEGSYIWGSRFFELSNHLGNVLATIQDRMTVTNASGVDYFDPVVVSAQDYYAFGMMMPGRTYSAPNGGYRYGFNGKENDNEVKGKGNQQDYGMRIYDPRLGRFLSVDPITKDYPMLTPYQFSSNSPIAGIDLDGLEFQFYYIRQTSENGKPKLSADTFVEAQDRTLQISAKVTVTHYVWGIIPVSSSTTPTYNFTLGDLGITPTVVWNGGWLVLPDGVDKNNLPALDDPIWSTFETTEQFTERFIKTGNALIQTISAFSDVYDILKGNVGTNKLGAKGANLDPPAERAKRLAQLKKGRPKYKKGLVEEVWEAAKKKGGGKVRDPKTGKEITWDQFKKRNGQWDMGHKPGKEYKDLKKQYENGEINWDQFKKEYNNPDNYRPELPSPNRSNNRRN